MLARFAGEWLLGIEDISDFVAEQRANARDPSEGLVIPGEEIYPVADPEVAGLLGLSSAGRQDH